MSILGDLIREDARCRMAAVAERAIKRLAAGDDTQTLRQRAEHWSRQAAAYGNPADQIRLAVVLFNRITVENMGVDEKARRLGEALMLLEVLVDQGYGPAAEVRGHVAALSLPAVIPTAVTSRMAR